MNNGASQPQAEAQQPESCASCVFAMWQGQIDIADDDKGTNKRPVLTGVCRRYPPQLLVIPGVQSKIVGVPGQPTAQLQPSFAPTHSEQWCGEYTRPEEYDDYKAARLGVTDEMIALDTPLGSERV